jgi:hypothetical protein
MELKVYYGGHSISDKGILKLKLKTDYTQQEEAGALYATIQASLYNLKVAGAQCGSFGLDSIKIDSKFDTTIILKGVYDDDLSTVLYDKIKNTNEDEMIDILIEKVGG